MELDETPFSLLPCNDSHGARYVTHRNMIIVFLDPQLLVLHELRPPSLQIQSPPRSGEREGRRREGKGRGRVKGHALTMELSYLFLWHSSLGHITRGIKVGLEI